MDDKYITASEFLVIVLLISLIPMVCCTMGQFAFLLTRKASSFAKFFIILSSNVVSIIFGTILWTISSHFQAIPGGLFFLPILVSFIAVFALFTFIAARRYDT